MSDEFEKPEEEKRSDDMAKAAAFLDPEDEGSYASDEEEEKVTIADPEPEESAAVATEASSAQLASADDSDDDDDDLDEPRVALNPIPDDGIRRRWYAIHAHSGQEATVQQSLIAKAEQEGLSELLTNVLVPMEEVTEFKSGEKKLSRRKYFPGYLLVQLPEHPERYADLWHLIKETTGVTGFIGSRNEPVPLEDEEVAGLVEEIRGERERPRAKVNFDIGERIKIIDGAFANFFGNIGEINEERGRMKVMIEIFERQTSVEVEFWQVEKI